MCPPQCGRSRGTLQTTLESFISRFWKCIFSIFLKILSNPLVFLGFGQKHVVDQIYPRIMKISDTLFGISFIYYCTLYSPNMKRFRPLSVVACPYHYETPCPTHLPGWTYWRYSSNSVRHRRTERMLTQQPLDEFIGATSSLDPSPTHINFAAVVSLCVLRNRALKLFKR